MSIAYQEAERNYPTQYWNGKYHPLKLLPLTTDDLQKAYMCGREAEPSPEQIEAAGKALYEREEPGSRWDDLNPETDEDRNIMEKYIDTARIMVEAARQAVM